MVRSYLKISMLYLLCWFVSSAATDNLGTKNHKKRQIYREEVLPHSGGRIPDTAFETDRLFLNRLQKDGISIPDGIIPVQRNPEVYPFHNKRARTVFRILVTSDGRYTPEVGRYHYHDDEAAQTLETTYLFPQIYGKNMELSPKKAAEPVYKPFRIPNPLLNQIKLQPKKKVVERKVVVLPKL